MIPFAPPRIDQKIIDAVSDALRSGWITTGPRTKELEKRIAGYVSVPAVLCLNSATAGLELMLRWFGVKEGDEVILPAYTYAATANVVMHCGARPVFADVGGDFNISISNIRKAVTPATKVVMPVDFAGWPCDYEEINALVSEPGIKQLFRPSGEVQRKLGRILVLSDAAHSLGGEYKGKKTGALTDVSVFSFHAVKNLTTAEGGAVCLNLPPPFDNAALYRELCVKSLHGQNKDALAKTQAGGWRYDIVEPGYKCNMTDIQAAIGLVELGRYEQDTLKRRMQIFNAYAKALETHSWAEVPGYKNDQKTSSCHVFPLRIKGATEQQRDAVIQKITGKGVSVNVHFIPVPMMSFYRSQGYDISHYPVAYNNYSREISLPVYYDLTDDQIGAVLDAVVQSVEEVLGKK